MIKYLLIQEIKAYQLAGSRSLHIIKEYNNLQEAEQGLLLETKYLKNGDVKSLSIYSFTEGVKIKHTASTEPLIIEENT